MTFPIQPRFFLLPNVNIGIFSHGGNIEDYLSFVFCTELGSSVCFYIHFHLKRKIKHHKHCIGGIAIKHNYKDIDFIFFPFKSVDNFTKALLLLVLTEKQMSFKHFCFKKFQKLISKIINCS